MRYDCGFILCIGRSQTNALFRQADIDIRDDQDEFAEDETAPTEGINQGDDSATVCPAM